MPAEWPGTSLIFMSISPNKNISFDAKPAPIERETKKSIKILKLSSFLNTRRTWVIVELQVSCSSVDGSVYMGRRPCDEEIFIVVPSWNDRSRWKLKQIWNENSKKDDSFNTLIACFIFSSHDHIIGLLLSEQNVEGAIYIYI